MTGICLMEYRFVSLVGFQQYGVCENCCVLVYLKPGDSAGLQERRYLVVFLL